MTDHANFTVTRVINNNAVFARTQEGEVILTGRGVGFGVKAGDTIAPSTDARSFIPLDDNKTQLLNALNRINDDLLAAVSAGVDKATDLLGLIAPSAYLSLAEHLAFAVQRTERGEAIHNPLLNEVNAAFPEEFNAALVVLAEVNDSVNVTLPMDEAAFIALHLNAARTGQTVKEPLATANALAGDFAIIRNSLGLNPEDDNHSAHAQKLASQLIDLRTRLSSARLRSNAAAQSIQRDLEKEFRAASKVICHIKNKDSLPHNMVGEATFLAVFLHGWLQT